MTARNEIPPVLHPPEPLVFTSAFGDVEYFECADQMILSLRAAGYDGRIVVLSDREYSFAGNVEAFVVKEPPNTPYKTLLHRYADLSHHGKILFMDSDIFFFKHPDPLFRACTDRLLVARENIRIGKNPHNIRGFTSEERKDPKLMDQHSINAGNLVFPSPEHYVACAETWREEWSRLGGAWDQPPLQKLLATGKLAFDYLPPDLFALPVLLFERRPFTGKMIFAHLCGYPRTGCKGKVLEGMKRLALCKSFSGQAAVIRAMRSECLNLYRKGRNA